ncbi:hypothetical protein [Streptomyces sp. GQFP]|uniref:hypothetical protein n=1 Tax=Streptomyces sp. GQFP TaxID=2907545 RepID=UPI001F36E9B8|nr:hypothetical protein [Streptomyces sp. GQFP]UIX33946.1 hypothetical protein LUX31_30280 [Streptomyces sp. GQFP]
MTEYSYSAADIEVLEFDTAVRKRPGMYFGVGPGSPKLSASLLCAVARHVLHPAARVAAEHTLRGLVEITGDSSFTVAMDHPHDWGASGGPELGYYDSLLGPEWWLLAAAAAVSRQVTVEMWCAGRGLRQELRGIRPLDGPQEFHPAEGSGTRVSFAVDPAYVGEHFVFPTDLANLDLHGPYCLEPAGPGYLLFRDVRHEHSTPEILHH